MCLSVAQPPVVVDFTPPFKRISFIKGIEEKGGFKIPEDLGSEGNGSFPQIRSSTCGFVYVWCFRVPHFIIRIECNAFLRKKVAELGINCPDPQTTTRLLDKVCCAVILCAAAAAAAAENTSDVLCCAP